MRGRVALDTPVNIHLTGCHHSCAQHYIGDIGLLGLQGADRRGRRHRRGLSHSRRRRLRSGRGDRARRSITTSRPRTRRRRSSACSRPIWRIAPRRRRAFWLSAERHDIDALQVAVRAARRSNELPPRPPLPSLIPESAPFTRRAARLAERLLRRPALARGAASRRCRRTGRGLDAWRARSRGAIGRGQPRMTTKRPGTTRPCRSPSA